MKKALSVLLVLAMVGAIFAAEPVANVKVAEFKGSATVTWGIDTWTGKTGFANGTDLSLKLNFMDGGSKSTAGDGVWGELVIKTAAWSVKNTGAINGVDADSNPKIEVEKAQINFGPAYVAITAGDTTVGKVVFHTALAYDYAPSSTTTSYFGSVNNPGPVNPGTMLNPAIGNGKGDSRAMLPAVGVDKSQGITIGYKSEIFDVAVDFRSVAMYSNDYAVAGEVVVKPIKDLNLKAGVTYSLSETKKDDLGLAFSADYKAAINDTYYVKPMVGLTYYSDKNSAGNKSVDVMDMGLAVLFGWGATKDANAGVYFLDSSDNSVYAIGYKPGMSWGTKKVTPGVSFAIYLPVVDKTTPNTGDAVDNLKNGTDMPYTIDFFSGEIVKNLTAAASFKSQFSSIKDRKFDCATSLGAKYAIAVEKMTITPKAGLQLYYNDDETVRGDYKSDTFVKLGVDLAGLVANTTFGAEWASRNLTTKNADLGTFNVYAKIAF